MREAITFHLGGLREEGQAAPEPHAYSSYVELPAQGVRHLK
jgi:predicted RNase H-like HicB family nuclease